MLGWLVAGTGAAAAGSVAYVDNSAPAAGNGATWATSFRFLQDALAVASNPDNGITEIRMAEGLYLPDRDEANPDGTGVRESTFQLISGVAVVGGYAGLGAPDPDVRDIGRYETVLSGDLALDDGPGFANNTENAYQVVTGNGVDGTAVLDGVTLTAGNANAIHVIDNGAGMNTDGGSPTVMHCTFTGNWAGTNGGGMSNADGSPVVVGCLFVGNVGGFGGGLANVTASPTVVNCAFVGNSASDGGGMLNIDAGPRVVNCVFIDNTAIFEGGGMFVRDLSEPLISNCTFTGNSAATGGGLRVSSLSDALVFNTILWDNTAPEGPEISLFLLSMISIAHSDVEGGEAAMFVDESSTGTWLAGNIDADPAFADRLGLDGKPGTGDEDVRLLAGSPCLDAGHNYGVPQDATDLDGDGNAAELVPLDLDAQPRFADDRAALDTGCGVPVVVDMGAYELQGSPFEIVLGDLGGDGIVGITDFLGLLAVWGPCQDACCLADLDLDGLVGITDFLILLGNWG